MEYATAIQEAALIKEDDIREWMPESFMLWQPLDKVGGDFYSLAMLGKQLVIAIGDCTGHGIPGAMFAMKTQATLEQIYHVNVFLQPGAMLDKLNAILQSNARKTVVERLADCGLDAGLCIFDPSRNRLIFSGARISLFHCRQGQIEEISGDPRSIGYYRASTSKGFTNHELFVHEDSCLYLCTDGLRDQAGGKHGLPFGKRRLKELLVSCAELEVDKQKQFITEALEEYKELHPQRDDITIIGFKPILAEGLLAHPPRPSKSVA